MDLPVYSQNPESEDAAQENYHQELNQTLRSNIGLNGFCISNITDAELRTTPILNGGTGLFVPGVASLMPAGTVYFVVDGGPACFVGQLVDIDPTSLVRFTTVPYP